MPDDAPTSERLESLRARWESGKESDTGSAVFLQLADEYRRLGRAEDAVAVLEEGLGRNPNHPAALVALGRCRLELGRPEEASEVLERVIAADPTQMVAYRLLVEAYVERGMAEEARQRLRVYGLLNDADPEIADLRRRIGEIERRHRDDPAGSGAPAAAVPETESPCEIAEPPEAEPAPADDPFPDLSEPSGRQRYLESLSGEGIFIDDGEGAPDAPVETEAGVVSEPAEAAAGEPAVEIEDSSDLFGLGPGSEAPAPDLSGLLDAEGAEEAPSTPRAPAGFEIPSVPGPPPAAPETSEISDPGPRPTVTLGLLYLRQGHRDEAEEIFREVLERDPENEEARAELESLVAAPEAPPVSPDEEPADRLPRRRRA